mmetsp:Transcript_72053/g.142934  ORF Transcript_72053/g.142934 Transcript_72053/m.142934 type:complete len:206 (+) Transcript_72053:1542-2159(+)
MTSASSRDTPGLLVRITFFAACTATFLRSSSLRGSPLLTTMVEFFIHSRTLLSRRNSSTSAFGEGHNTAISVPSSLSSAKQISSSSTASEQLRWLMTTRWLPSMTGSRPSRSDCMASSKKEEMTDMSNAKISMPPMDVISPIRRPVCVSAEAPPSGAAIQIQADHMLSDIGRLSITRIRKPPVSSKVKERNSSTIPADPGVQAYQ